MRPSTGCFLRPSVDGLTDEEFEILLSAKGGDYEQWLTDCQWALLNKLDFVFNY